MSLQRWFENGWLRHHKTSGGHIREGHSASFSGGDKLMPGKPQSLVMRADPPGKLLNDLRTLIIDARQGVARRVNSALVLLYWKVGERVRKDILKEKRAEYG